MSSTVSGIPAGTPSTTTPRAGPWDSPQVVSRKILPNALPMPVRAPSLAHIPRARRDPATEESIVQLDGSPEPKLLVETLRARVRHLRAKPYAPSALLPHFVNCQD